jgi:organic hydroperoxide reductase OsmC/OhrA
MDPLPHRYEVGCRLGPEGAVRLEAESLPPLDTLPPREFGGPGDHWSPETLLVAAVADCFSLGFRAIASASRFEWHALDCRVCGTLDRSEGKTRFTEFRIEARLRIPAAGSRDRAQRLLEKAEHNCLVTNSLSARVELALAIEPG